jgi:hypothetical protein
MVCLFSDSARTTDLLLGNQALRGHMAEIRRLRQRCAQEDDLTTDPEYFIAANTLANRRCAAVLVRRDQELEACVFFYEHTRLGIGLGLFRGGDYIGESLVAGPAAYPRGKHHHQGRHGRLHCADGAAQRLPAIPGR